MDEIQNSNLESISQLTKSIERLSLYTKVTDQTPLTHNSDKLPQPSQYVEFQLQNQGLMQAVFEIGILILGTLSCYLGHVQIKS